MNRSEELTQAFYEWESYLRGSHVFDYPVQLEPPYIQGSYLPIPSERKQIDDGHVPSIFQKIAKAFKPEERTELLEYDRTPEAPTCDRELRCLGIKLNYKEKIDLQSAEQFLSLLSESEGAFSFEIIAVGQEILIHFVCAESDFDRLQSLVDIYFEDVQTFEIELEYDYQIEEETSLIVDFGLQEEVMRPLEECKRLDLDPLSSFFSIRDSLTDNERCIMQVLFKGVQNPWSRELLSAVSDGQGGSFFADAPEMPKLAQQKVSSPLFGVVVRLVVQCESAERAERLGQSAIYNIASIGRSQVNALVPQTNEGYDFLEHQFAVKYRVSQRLGMLLNTNELVSLVHFPQPALIRDQGMNRKTKKVPAVCTNKKYEIGTNVHEGEETIVTLDDEAKLRHVHICGATGTGKSTFIVKSFLEDLAQGNGAMLIDPHGDVVDDILARVPQERLKDVVVIDPSDMDYPVGFNLLEAKTEQEKLLLSSDLIDLFKREATSWGDVMTAVLSNTINAFVESTKGGTLFELKKFLSDEKFRNEFLKTVEDPITRYYFQNDFKSLKRNSLSPLLTRLDNFLRPRVLRNMFIQKEGINFHKLISENKIVLVKLSLGLIGQRNASFLGSLLITKLNQSAFARQSVAKGERTPFYLYLDEFQNVITDSLDALLSGARKYGLGLVLAHQSLSQIKNKSDYILQSVLNNAHIRIVFRTSEQDAPTLAKGFSSIEDEDIMSQAIGQAYVRVGSSSNDFSIETSYFEDIDESIKQANTEYCISHSREQYGADIAEIQGLIDKLYPNNSEEEKEVQKPKATEEKQEEPKQSQSEFETKKKEYLTKETKKKQIREHQYLQNLCTRLAQDRGYIVETEKTLETGGRVDVHLQNDNISIACEISVTNKAEYEVKNIQKCIKANYAHIVCMSQDKKHLEKIMELAKKNLEENDFAKVLFIDPRIFAQTLDSLTTQGPSEQKILGYRVRVNKKDK